MFKSRKLGLFSLVLVAMLVLAACNGADTATDEPPPPPQPDPTDEPAAVMEPILIGGIHPMTGGLAADGINMDNALRMAIDDLNAAGGVLGGRMFEYLSSDSTGSADVGQTEAERLVGEGAVALVCCFQSSVTTNVAAIAEREGVPLVIDVAVSDAILDQGHTFTFRLQPNATSMGVNGANFLKAIAEVSGDEITSIAYLYEGTTGFGDSVRAAFVAQAAVLGIEVLGEFAYAPFEVADLTTELTAIQALGPDALVVTGYYGDGLLAARGAEDVGLDVKVVYGVAQGAYDQPQFVTDAGDLAQCFFDSNYHWDASDANALALRESYEAAYGEPMRTGSVLAYQAMVLIADAIERAGSADPGDIRDALAATNFADHFLPYEGAIQFDESGETIVASPVVMQVQDGAVVQVWPPALAEADPVFPCTSW